MTLLLWQRRFIRKTLDSQRQLLALLRRLRRLLRLDSQRQLQG